MAYNAEFMHLSRQTSGLKWPSEDSPEMLDPDAYLKSTEATYHECLAIQRSVDVLLEKPLPDRLRPVVMALRDALRLIRQTAELGRKMAHEELARRAV